MKRNRILVLFAMACCMVTNIEAQVSQEVQPATNASEPATDSNEQIFEKVDQNPSFPGGSEELMKWLRKNMKYPSEAMENNIQGKVTVQFVIDKDGSIVDPKVTHSVDPSLDKEALRIVQAMPRWTPGKQKGKTVRVRFYLPLTFSLGFPSTNSQTSTTKLSTLTTLNQKIEKEAEANYQMGTAFWKAQDIVKAMTYLEQAAAAGHVDAQFLLGLICIEGKNINHDYEKGIKWLEKAATQGHKDAQRNLAAIYYQGNIVEKNYQKAEYWAKKYKDMSNTTASPVSTSTE